VHILDYRLKGGGGEMDKNKQCFECNYCSENWIIKSLDGKMGYCEFKNDLIKFYGDSCENYKE